MKKITKTDFRFLKKNQKLRISCESFDHCYTVIDNDNCTTFIEILQDGLRMSDRIYVENATEYDIFVLDSDVEPEYFL